MWGSWLKWGKTCVQPLADDLSCAGTLMMFSWVIYQSASYLTENELPTVLIIDSLLFKHSWFQHLKCDGLLTFYDVNLIPFDFGLLVWQNKQYINGPTSSCTLKCFFFFFSKLLAAALLCNVVVNLNCHRSASITACCWTAHVQTLLWHCCRWLNSISASLQNPPVESKFSWDGIVIVTTQSLLSKRVRA